jgi:hypothetical protein
MVLVAHGIVPIVLHVVKPINRLGTLHCNAPKVSESWAHLTVSFAIFGQRVIKDL